MFFVCACYLISLIYCYWFESWGASLHKTSKFQCRSVWGNISIIIIQVNLHFLNTMTVICHKVVLMKLQSEPKFSCLLAWSLIFIGHYHLSPSCPSLVTHDISAQKHQFQLISWLIYCCIFVLLFYYVPNFQLPFTKI